MEQLVKARHISGKERENVANALMRQYARGASIRELAAESGRSYGFIYNVLKEGGVTLRARGGYRRRS